MQAGTCDAHQLLAVMRDARAESAHGEAGADDDGISQILDDGLHLIKRMGDGRTGRLPTGLVDDLLELLAVLAAVDGFQRGADQLHVIAFQHARLAQRYGGVQRRLPAQRG